MQLRFWKRDKKAVDRKSALRAIRGLERQQRSLNHTHDSAGDSVNDLSNAINETMISAIMI